MEMEEDEVIPSEQSLSCRRVAGQGVSVRSGVLSQVHPQKSHLSEKCVPVLKDILQLTELQAAYPGQTPYFGGCPETSG